MPNKSLADQLGWRYVRDFFSSAWLVKDNKLYLVVSADAGGLICSEYDLSTDVTNYKETIIPHKEITSFSDFSYPKLGYRNIVGNDRKAKPSIAALSLNRSVHRGFRLELVNSHMVNHSGTLNRSPHSEWDFLRAEQKAKIVFFPEWKTWTAGLNDLKDNKYFGFAVNEDIAVTISCSHVPEHEYDVLFRGAVVGGVTQDGTITFDREHKVNTAITKMFKEEISSDVLQRK